MIFSMIHSVDGGVGRIGRLFDGFGLFDRFGSTATQKAKSKMKKLLVLAAVAAMAMGAQADYTYNLDLDGAQAVYWFMFYEDARGKDKIIEDWQEEARPMFLDETVARDVFGGETWAQTYANTEMALSGNGNKFSGSSGSFSFVDSDGGQNWGLLVLTDATEISPGAAYSVYYGTSSTGGGSITLDTAPIESGHLMTDSPTPAPEPTSGLLLLLGVAGLALKRKRA